MSAFIYTRTPETVVDWLLHWKYVAPQRIATVHENHNVTFMSSTEGISRGQAVDFRALMIEAATASREGAKDNAYQLLDRFLYELERVNETVDSVRIARLIEDFASRIEGEGE